MATITSCLGQGCSPLSVLPPSCWDRGEGKVGVFPLVDFLFPCGATSLLGEQCWPLSVIQVVSLGNKMAHVASISFGMVCLPQAGCVHFLMLCNKLPPMQQLNAMHTCHSRVSVVQGWGHGLAGTSVSFWQSCHQGVRQGIFPWRLNWGRICLFYLRC